jgi:hypothetical protein
LFAIKLDKRNRNRELIKVTTFTIPFFKKLSPQTKQVDIQAESNRLEQFARECLAKTKQDEEKKEE